tara:strand:- start:424 stop:633 length:210 start_codon:yes stop_codon:yes gene_type:complete
MKNPTRSRSRKKSKSGHKYNQSFGKQVQENAYADANLFGGSNGMFQSPSQQRGFSNDSYDSGSNNRMFS